MPERFHALPLRITGLSVVFTLLVLAVAITPAVWAQANVTVTPSNVLQITSPISNGMQPTSTMASTIRPLMVRIVIPTPEKTF